MNEFLDAIENHIFSVIVLAIIILYLIEELKK